MLQKGGMRLNVGHEVKSVNQIRPCAAVQAKGIEASHHFLKLSVLFNGNGLSTCPG